MAVLFVNVLLKKKNLLMLLVNTCVIILNKVSLSSRYFGFRNVMVLTKTSELCSAPVSSKLSFFPEFKQTHSLSRYVILKALQTF